ncbi:sensor domain-containing protein [Brevibacterium luteolum]|uniref:sensor domain-containing protein n=1 Tax=Brevibacterium luteolum TaxID=199591 RepID=UPI001C24FDBC|nr:sensor domain-containing protein [Brevibacterium luteolum]MBU8579117.1 sensor domain-containing protein [Brevibacterium luteolum]
MRTRHATACAAASLLLLAGCGAGGGEQLESAAISERIDQVSFDGEAFTAHGNETVPSEEEIGFISEEIADTACAEALTAVQREQVQMHEHFSHGEHARADLDATSYPDADAAEAGLERVRAYVESCASYERTSGGETYASSTLTPVDVEVDGADAALGYAEKQADGFVFLYVYAQAGNTLVSAYGAPDSPAPIDDEAYRADLQAIAGEALGVFG